MPLQLIKTTKECYKAIGKGTTQVLVEGDLIVPDIKPDISAVLRIGAAPVIEEEKAAEDRIGFKGGLQVNVIYMAKKSDKPVHSMHDTLLFEDFINIDGTTRLSDVEVSAELSHLEYKLINDRKINVKAIITVTACSWHKVEVEYLQGAEDDRLQIKECTMPLEKRTENKKDRFVIKEAINIGSTKAEMADILECRVDICHKESKAIRGGVSVKGEAVVNVLYVGTGDDSVIESAEAVLPFNGTVEVPDASEDMQSHAKLRVEKIEPYILPNEDGEDRVVDVEITIGVIAGASTQEEMQLIEDVYAMDEEIEAEMQQLEYPTMTGKTEARVNVKEALALDNGYPDIMQVVKAWGTCYVDNIVPGNNNIVVEGAASVQVMYIAKDDEMPVQAADFMIPFEQKVELKGVNADTIIEAECSVEKVNINMLTGREIEAAVSLVIEAEAHENTQRQMVADIKDSVKPKHHVASVVIYVVQKGDTLWKIAKKYNTTVDNILLVNDIENTEFIYPGQKLLILRCCK